MAAENIPKDPIEQKGKRKVPGAPMSISEGKGRSIHVYSLGAKPEHPWASVGQSQAASSHVTANFQEKVGCIETRSLKKIQSKYFPILW